MKIIINIILSSIVLQLIGCASNQVEQKKYSQIVKQDDSIFYDESMQKASERIKNFANSDVTKTLIPYVALVNKINSIENEDNMCVSENIKIYQEMYALNKSSLIASSLLSACEVGSTEEQLVYLDNYQSTIQVLLDKRNGSSLTNSVNIREFSEAEFILTSAGYTVLDQEVIEHGEQFAYRVHAIDNETGDFEYHYYNNFNFLRQIYSSFKSDISDSDVTAITLRTFLESKTQAAANYVTKKLLEGKKYKEIISFLEKNEDLSPISRINLARAYFYLGLDDKLDTLIDDIVTQKELGDINASVFIAELMTDLNGNKASNPDVNLLLDDVDQRTIIGNGAFLLAQVNYNRGNYKLFKKWSEISLQKNLQAFYPKVYKLLKRQKDYPALIVFLEKQQNQNNLQAVYDLANAYHYGQGVDIDHIKENELYALASEQGHQDSMYNLASNFESSKFVEQDIDKALFWFKKAGTARSLNQVGYIYYEGVGGIDIDYPVAMQWFQKASNLGNTFSKSNLGLFYQYGKGVGIDYEKAAEFYKAGLTVKYPKTYERLGDLYRYSLGEKYYKDAVYWYKQGAIRGFTTSQYELATLYSEKLDNEPEAIKWYTKIAKSNDGRRIAWTARNFETGLKYLKKDRAKSIELYEIAVKLGDSFAQGNLGYLYDHGIGVEENKVKAKELFASSAAQGDASGMNSLAIYYKSGLGGLTIDLDKAFELYSKASQKGNGPAHYNLGKMYFYGQGTDIDHTKALELFKLAEAEKNEAAYYYLGYLHLKGNDINKDYEKAKYYFELSIELAHSTDSAEQLAEMYILGLGVQNNELKAIKILTETAILNKDISDIDYYIATKLSHVNKINNEIVREYYNKSIENNNALAMTDLAYRYLEEENEYHKVAIKLYEKAVSLGNAQAQANLGFEYEMGHSVEKNIDKARSLYEKSAAQNNSFGLNNLATFYRDGNAGLSVDLEKSVALYTEASALGNKYAHHNLAIMYFNGYGVKRDYHRAFKLFKSASRLDYLDSYLYLGFSYLKGLGVKRDYDSARKYFKRSEQAGNWEAADNLAVMYSLGLGSEKNELQAISYFKRAANLNKKIIDIDLYVADSFHFGDSGNDINLKLAREYYNKAIFNNNASAMASLAYLIKTNGSESEIERAIELYEKASEQGIEYADFNLGELYFEGKGVEQNYTKAKEHFELALEAEDPDAAIRLAVMYIVGIGVVNDLEKAQAYFEKAIELDPDITDIDYVRANIFHFGKHGAEVNYEIAREYYNKSIINNNPTSMNNLAEIYRWGKGVEIDYQRAITLYKKAIALDKGIAMFNMSELYRDGHGVEKNEEKSFEWMKKSAENGFSDAYVDLSGFYKNGYGTNKDQRKSVMWLEKGVGEGLSSAQYELAIALYQGEGIKKNIEKANSLMRLSAGEGFQKAIDVVENGFGEI